MEALGPFDTGGLVAVMDAALDDLTVDRVDLSSDVERLAAFRDAVRVAGRLQAWIVGQAHLLDDGQVAWRAYGTSAATWMTDALRISPREAHRMIAAGRRLVQFPLVGDAVAAGGVLPAQADAITSVLADLPADLPAEAVRAGEGTMIGLAGSHHGVELRRLSGHLLEVLAPDVAEGHEAARLERELAAARKNRHLAFFRESGRVSFRGSLPTLDGEAFIALIDSYTTSPKRQPRDSAQTSEDLRDLHGMVVTPGMRKADALVALLHAHQHGSTAPNHRGDRPRVVVSLDYQTLLDAAARLGRDGISANPSSGPLLSGGRLGQRAITFGLVGRCLATGERVEAGELRRLLCDCEVLPVVMNGRSAILDAGRSRRLVTPDIRAALDVRDEGCVFPGCDKPPSACEAHHILPWWAHGHTELANLVLLCPHHHGIIEPSRDPHADRWSVRLPTAGPAEVIPPRYVDPHQTPRTHARYLGRLRR